MVDAATANTNFERALPRLVATHEVGRLVPFIGSGMSRDLCSDWIGFVEALERAVDPDASLPDPEPAGATGTDDLVRRANAAVRALKGREDDAFARAVHHALVPSHTKRAAIPAQTLALARVRWPLALTTNYDNCYAAAFAKLHEDVRLSVVGRSAEDCQRVLNVLSTAGRPLLWALQGHLANVPHGHAKNDVSPGLAAQLVVGHEAYRRVTYREQHFRRAFAEVFRQRSLLFLGAGLRESYLQELFGEVLEIYGPATRPHYAFVQEGDVDPAFLLARFQIVCLVYPKGEHGMVTDWLTRLADAVGLPQSAPVAWQWGHIHRPRRGHWTSVPDFELVRGPLPQRAARGECLAVSAGGSGRNFYLSEGIRAVIAGWGVDPQTWANVLKPPYLGRFDGHAVYAVRARNEKDERNLADIYHACLALFEQVAGTHKHIRLQLLATGGLDKAGARQQWKVRRYPERFSFVQTVRAWGAWRRANPDVDCRLSLHVVLDSVTADVASGRIDVLELLSCPDMRFFVEVSSQAGELERRLFQSLPTDTLDSVVSALQLAPPMWEMRVSPPPGVVMRWQGLGSATRHRLLESLGVLPGSTIHFRRVGSADTEPSKP